MTEASKSVFARSGLTAHEEVAIAAQEAKSRRPVWNSVDRILRKGDIEYITGFTERHIRDMEAAGTFPRRFNPDPNSKVVGWLESAVQQWVEERASSRAAS